VRAAVYDRYGTFPEIRDVPMPVPGERDVLVRVHASSVNSWDWDEHRGWLKNKKKAPQHPILGADVAGVVEAVGATVTRFKPGDAVFADLCEGGWGGFGDYVAADEKWFALKPEGMGFAEAAAIPQAGMLALQAVRKRSLVAGESVLINGAGGGVGSFAIQMAKRLGAEVTGVDRGSKLDFMRAVGADHVVDFEHEDFADGSARYDLVIDMVARRSTFAHARVLKPGGRYVIIGGTLPRILGAVTLGSVVSLVSSRKVGLMLYRPNAADLGEMARLFAAGVKPPIDTVYPLEQVADALRHVGEGRVRGKVVVSLAG
jgi:NADPH:quinone reductase-like Zn-dependent oxidoreductase